MNRQEIDITLDNCIHGRTRFLYVSPERLRTEIMIERTKQMDVSLLAVDEAHCISQWGYDFRPSYLLIADFRTLIPDTPVMALTASATSEVQADIVEKLQMKAPRIFRQSFARANLSYSTFEEENKERKLAGILQKVPGTAIVYVRTRKRTQYIADWLKRQNIRADYYHAGLSFADRTEKQNAWINNKIRVIVATNAFGMGIDKPDVRAVVHMDLPDSLEAYYQEAGRAGRDSRKAYAVALYNKKDIDDLEKGIEQKYPSTDILRRVYQSLSNYFKIPVGGGEFSSYDFDIKDFTTVFGLVASDTHYALKLLEEEGFIQLSDGYNDSSKLHLLVNNRQLYDYQLRYPDYDKFLRVLLRMYGGELFTEYVRIVENDIAHALYISTKEVLRGLNFLQERSIIVYEKRRDKPQLTFLTPRFDSELLPLNTSGITKKKERDVHKMQAVIHYAEHEYQCRTLLLLNYFNEKDGSPCGICDNCVRRKKEKPEDVDSGLGNEIMVYLRKDGPLTPRLLAGAFDQIPEKKLLEVVRFLIDEEQIGYDESGRLKSL